MPRGGKRKGAGRKSAWNAGKTKAVKLPELLIPEIVEFAKMVDCTLVDGLYGQEKVDSIERLVDILFDELDDRKILERVAQKLLTLHTNEEPQGIVDSAIALENLGTDTAKPNNISDPQGNEFIEQNIARGAAQKLLETNAEMPIASTKVQPAKTDFSLTPDQLIALEKMKQFIQTPRHKGLVRMSYFRLTGYAGTGKSFLIVQLMKWLLNQKINFVGGSPTNKAVKNLKKMASEAQVSIEAHTVAQLLGQQPELNEETGKEEFITKGTDSIGGYQVALIDEFSMISKSNFKDINQAVWHTPTKVIFVGDGAQLPPVGESEPIIATHEYIKDEATLSSVVRYDGDIAQRIAQIVA